MSYKGLEGGGGGGVKYIISIPDSYLIFYDNREKWMFKNQM